MHTPSVAMLHDHKPHIAFFIHTQTTGLIHIHTPHRNWLYIHTQKAAHVRKRFIDATSAAF